MAWPHEQRERLFEKGHDPTRLFLTRHGRSCVARRHVGTRGDTGAGGDQVGARTRTGGSPRPVLGVPDARR